MSEYGVFSGPYFPVFELNKNIYSVKTYIQPEYRKIGTWRVICNTSRKGHNGKTESGVEKVEKHFRKCRKAKF